MSEKVTIFFTNIYLRKRDKKFKKMMFDTFHFTNLKPYLPSPYCNDDVCPYFDFEEEGFMKQCQEAIFSIKRLNDTINHVLSFVRVTAIDSIYYPNTLNFTLINIYLNDTESLIKTIEPGEYRIQTGEFATFLHEVLNKYIDGFLSDVKDTLFKCKYNTDPNPVDLNERRVATPIIWVDDRKVRGGLEIGRNDHHFEKQFNINGGECPDICYCVDMKYYKDFLYSHSIYNIDSLFDNQNVHVKSIEVMNGAYINLEYFRGEDDDGPDYKVLNIAMKEGLQNIFSKKVKPPSIIFRKIEDYYRNPQILRGLPEYPKDVGWTIYYMCFYEKYLQSGDAHYKPVSMLTSIDWEKNCIKSLREGSIDTYFHVSKWTDEELLINAEHEANYRRFEEYSRWVTLASQIPLEFFS